MSHFFVVALVPRSTAPEEVEGAVGSLLAPYDEDIRVEPYHSYLNERSVEYRKQKYETDDFAEIARRQNEQYADADPYADPDDMLLLDEQGLYTLSTYNPRSKWDYWIIGGRWNGAIRNAPRDDGNGGFNFSSEFHHLAENILPASELDHDLGCFAVVTPDGAWHEKGRMGWWAVVSDEKADETWDVEVRRLIATHQDCYMVGLDCHI